MTGRVEGKVAFVTGLARGQGRAHAVRLAEEGADIIGLDICAQLDVGYPMSTPEDLAETVELVEKTGRRIIARVGDVRDRDAQRAALDDGLAEFGRVDLVVANAGVMPAFGSQAATMDAWQLCLDVMLTGVLHTVEVTYPRLVEQGEGGSIVLTSSMAALKPMMRTEGQKSLGLLGYSAAKAGLVNMARNYASFLARHNIRVNTVHPTSVNTPMIHNEMTDTHFRTVDPEDTLVLVSALPVPEVEPEDIANTVLWLCSGESRYFTGNAVRVDAGASLR
jgi:SDR family mycofactocin-dependent oxidoreductase